METNSLPMLMNCLELVRRCLPSVMPSSKEEEGEEEEETNVVIVEEEKGEL